MSNSLLFLSLFTVLPNTIGASQSHVVVTGHNNSTPKNVHKDTEHICTGKRVHKCSQCSTDE